MANTGALKQQQSRAATARRVAVVNISHWQRRPRPGLLSKRGP
jgi:hypothetical protein